MYVVVSINDISYPNNQIHTNLFYQMFDKHKNDAKKNWIWNELVFVEDKNRNRKMLNKTENHHGILFSWLIFRVLADCFWIVCFFLVIVYVCEWVFVAPHNFDRLNVCCIRQQIIWVYQHSQCEIKQQQQKWTNKEN